MFPFEEQSALFEALHNQSHHQHRACWETLQLWTLTALRMRGQPDTQAALILARLRHDLPGYPFRGNLTTWLTVRIAWHVQHIAGNQTNDPYVYDR